MIKEADTHLDGETECHFCGRKLGDLGFYYFRCHTCGKSYCVVHSEEHTTTHPVIKHA